MSQDSVSRRDIIRLCAKRVGSWEVEAPVSRNYTKSEGEQGVTTGGKHAVKGEFYLLNGKHNTY